MLWNYCDTSCALWCTATPSCCRATWPSIYRQLRPGDGGAGGGGAPPSCWATLGGCGAGLRFGATLGDCGAPCGPARRRPGLRLGATRGGGGRGGGGCGNTDWGPGNWVPNVQSPHLARLLHRALPIGARRGALPAHWITRVDRPLFCAPPKRRTVALAGNNLVRDAQLQRTLAIDTLAERNGGYGKPSTPALGAHGIVRCPPRPILLAGSPPAPTFPWDFFHGGIASRPRRRCW